MSDQTENTRRLLSEQINKKEGERAALELQYGQVWDSLELPDSFVVHGFLAPFVLVTRKSDDVKGTLLFQHSPRYYFGWEEAKGSDD